MSIADKMNYLLETKNQIKAAIEEKGVTVSDTDTFRSYATKISEIQSGGTNEDGLSAMRKVNNKLYLTYLFYSFPSVFFPSIILDANALMQKVSNTVLEWVRNNNLENISDIQYTFAQWNTGNSNYVYYNLDISHWKFASNVKMKNSFSNSFFNSITLPDNIMPDNLIYAFYSNPNLLHIKGIIDVKNVTQFNSMLSGSPNVQEIYLKNIDSVVGFDFSVCKNLIKNCLVFLLENAKFQNTTKTLKFGSENLAKLTAEEIAIGTNKGYTIS